jgi:hypothetical protein
MNIEAHEIDTVSCVQCLQSATDGAATNRRMRGRAAIWRTIPRKR